MNSISLTDEGVSGVHIGGATFGISKKLIVADAGFWRLLGNGVADFEGMIERLIDMELLDTDIDYEFQSNYSISIYLGDASCMSINPCELNGTLVGVFVTFTTAKLRKQEIVVDRFSKKIVNYGISAAEVLGIQARSDLSVNKWKMDLDKFADELIEEVFIYTRMMIIRGGIPAYIGICPVDFVDNANRFISLQVVDLNSKVIQEQHAAEHNEVVELIASQSNNIVALSPNGIIMGASGVLMKHWGWSADEVQGRPFISIVAPSDKDKITAYLQENLDIAGKIICIRRDGTLFEAAFILTPNEIGGKLYTIMRIELEESASDNIQLFSRYVSVFNSLPAMLAVGDEADLTYANRAFFEFFKCGSIEEFKKQYRSLGATFIHRSGCLYPTTDGAWLSTALGRMHDGFDNQVMIYSETLREYRTFSLKVATLTDYADRHIFLFADITDLDNYHSILQDVKYMLEHDVEKHSQEKRNVEILLTQQQELLVQQSKLAAMGNMIGIIAHQWKQPLNVIGLMAQNLEEDFDFGELSKENLGEYTDNIMKQVRYMSETIDDFSGFFRPSKTIIQFDLLKSVESVANLLRSFMVKNNITIDKILDTADSAPSPTVLGYPNELKQVLMNIMNNARDAIVMNTKEGELSEGKITINVGEDAHSGYITVSDSGGGIPEHIMGSLFEPYVTTKGADGTGIGLYMSKYIMELMSGSISAENKDGGAVFTLKLPKA
ncbi:MAG: PAS domain-containing sensor histidine kinase [Deferribacteraceae bacterium]|jgi:PAS domain S-box-containing protein|nr:PAS domain-containing sensor histidine kinase [Deferribacteraceae bacterium]